MQCHRCTSPRIIRFLDGFGNRRVFCKGCHESFLLEEVIVAQKKLVEFGGGEYGNERIGNVSIGFSRR